MPRSAVTRPLVVLRVLIEDQAVRAAADEMITLTYAMRDAYATSEQLSTSRSPGSGCARTGCSANASTPGRWPMVSLRSGIDGSGIG
ncbi:hypothetical protein [Streptomyces sp. NPDC000878]